MKKFLFLLAILAGAGILILLSFSKETWGKRDDVVTIDFSEWEKLYIWDQGKKSFVETAMKNVGASPNTTYFHRFSPIDGIYYRSNDKTPLKTAKKWGTNVITLWSGLFVCNIQTGLEKYEFLLPDLTLAPKGRGVFLVDTTTNKIKIFSFDTFIDTELVAGPKRTHVTAFTLFPSLLFSHDPNNTNGLREADILRISIIDSIRYLDVRTPEDSRMLFASNNIRKDEQFLKEVQEDITNHIKAFVGLYSSISEQGIKKTNTTALFDGSSTLLINDSKKEVILKNTLVENIRKLLVNPSKIQYKTSIEDTLSEMKELSQRTYLDGLAILRQYYSIAIFSHFTSKDNVFSFSDQESPLLALVEKANGNSLSSKQWEYYIHLSDLFSVYYFLDMNQGDLNSHFENILQKILDNKVLSKNEFLPFAFFVTQYLSTGPIIPNEETILTIAHLIQITNDYYANNKSDENKLATLTSTIFYNYTRIFSKTYNIFLSTFVDKTPDGLLLKKDYLEGDSVNLPQSFIDTFTKTIDKAKGDVKSKKDALYAWSSFQENSQIVDSFTLLSTTLKSFDTLISMFTNYPKYLNDFHLSDISRTAKGIYIEKAGEMSREILETYLKKFNNLDISSLQLTNNFQKDAFYEIQVIILWNTFSFKLWEQNHILADISYTDTSWKKHTFPNITIPLDQKEEQLKELYSGANDPLEKYKYDFKNFFEITFLKGDSASLPNPWPETSVITSGGTDDASTNPEIQLFIQRELIDKDFKNIANFLPIGFKNVHASINNGTYLIDISKVLKTFVWANNNFAVELDSKYIFNRHSFSRLNFKVLKEWEAWVYDFNGVSIEILPARISVLSLPETFKDLGYYIDTIQSSYKDQKSIIIDLTGKKVLMDNASFTPKFGIQQ